jgi:VanZ family protein
LALSAAGSTRLLFALVVLLIVYGSLYPGHFANNAVPASQAAKILLESWPKPITMGLSSDIVLNVLIYFPAGLLGALSISRRLPVARATLPLIATACLSVLMEFSQVYIPGRVPSLLDVATNSFGGALGVAGALLLPQTVDLIWPHTADRLARQPGAALLLGFWLSSQWIPFVPGIGVFKLKTKLIAAFTLNSAKLPWEILVSAASWLLAMVLFEALVDHPIAAKFSFVLPLLVLPLRFLVWNQHPSAGDLIGAAAAMAIGRVLLYGKPYRVQAVAAILLFALVLGGLAPLTFHAKAGTFSWIPLDVSYRIGNWEIAGLVLVAKAFRYGGAVWLLGRCGIGLMPAGLMVATLLGGIEWIQTYLPGRSAESTDPVLCLLLAVALLLFEKSSAFASRKYALKVSDGLLQPRP